MNGRKLLALATAIMALTTSLLTGCGSSVENKTASPPVATAAKFEDYFVSTDYVAANQNNLLIIDTRSPADYAAGHIPGAINFHYLNYIKQYTTSDGQTVSYIIPNEAEFVTIANQLGITPNTSVVTYGDDIDWGWSARLAWTLRVYGHTKVVTLDGGFPKWRYVDGRPFTTTATLPTPNTVSYKVGGYSDILATKEQVLAAAKGTSTGTVLFDIRTPGEYIGAPDAASGTAPIAGNPRNGHIPGAVFINWQNVLTDNSAGITFTPAGSTTPRKVQVFKSQADLIASFASLGITKDKEIIPYCEGGIRSSQYTLLLKALGYPYVRNYDGSWNEWSRLDPAVYPLRTGLTP